MDFAAARHNMVESQVRPNRVTDPLLVEAMSSVPRERFVPEERRSIAYVDEALSIAPGRWLMEPMITGQLLQIAEVRRTDVVLVVGCATGYTAAVLSRLAGTVVALESDPALAAQATTLLAELGADNAVVVTGDLQQGYAKQAPYELVVFDGAVAEIPDAYAGQVAEGGRLVAVVARAANRMGRGTLFSRHGGRLTPRDHFDAGTPFLPGFAPQPAFTF